MNAVGLKHSSCGAETRWSPAHHITRCCSLVHSWPVLMFMFGPDVFMACIPSTSEDRTAVGFTPVDLLLLLLLRRLQSRLLLLLLLLLLRLHLLLLLWCLPAPAARW